MPPATAGPAINRKTSQLRSRTDAGKPSRYATSGPVTPTRFEYPIVRPPFPGSVPVGGSLHQQVS